VSSFTSVELEFLKTQRLGRLATVDPKGRPQNSPVGFRYNAELDVIEIAGRAMSQSKKFRNIGKNPHVAFVVDDVLPPWSPRMVEIRGRAEALSTGGKGFYGDGYPADDGLIRIHPTQIISFGLEGEGFNPSNRKVEQVT